MRNNNNNNKYLDLAKELKEQWNMKVTVVLIVIDALDKVMKVLEKGLEDLEIRGRVKTIETTALLKSVWILRKILEIGGDLLSLRLQWKTIS